MIEVRVHMNLLVIHVHRLKGSDLLAHRTDYIPEEEVSEH
jgi:hypothetical protein